MNIKNLLKQGFQIYLAKYFFILLKNIPLNLGLKKWTFINEFKVHSFDGQSFLLFNNAFHLETRLFWEGFLESNWEKKSREIWVSLSKRSITILDIGANSGIFSVLAKAHHPEAKVYAFEPQPNIFKILEKNNEINNYDINCNAIALSDITGEFPFYNTGVSTFEGSKNTTHGSLNKDWRTKDQYSILVKVERLDVFILENGLNRIDLIKIDVETLEYQVLNGYGERLWIDRPIIILEIQNENYGNKLEKLFELKHYDFFWINEVKGLYRVVQLGFNSRNGSGNYLLCPLEKVHLLTDFIYY